MARPSRRDVWIAFLAILALVLMVYVATCNRAPNPVDPYAPRAVASGLTPPVPV